MEIIYCGGGNPAFASIAIEAGFRYGSRLPETVYGPLYFADQDWCNPDRVAYMAALAKHRPYMASVLDLEQPAQLNEVLDWAEDAAQYVEVVMIIPKYTRAIESLPRTIGGKAVRLGYSVPTSHGGTEVPAWEFCGWPVHLLGGSPQQQMKLFRYFDTQSVDGNMAQKMATRLCAFWDGEKVTKRGQWPTLTDYDGQRWDGDGPAEAFRRSCKNIMAAWKKIVKITSPSEGEAAGWQITM